MAKEVIILPVAKSNYENILEYLSSNWDISVTDSFIERFDAVCSFLESNTSIYPFVNKAKKIQQCVLTEHNILFFREMEKVVEILMIFDTRQDPKKLSKLLK